MTIFGVVYVPKNKIEYFRGAKSAPLTRFDQKINRINEYIGNMLICSVRKINK